MRYRDQLVFRCGANRRATTSGEHREIVALVVVRLPTGVRDRVGEDSERLRFLGDSYRPTHAAVWRKGGPG
jgi:hypothetical protein